MRPKSLALCAAAFFAAAATTVAFLPPAEGG
jgi:hypothetical protein